MHGREAILVVDDDCDVRDSLKALLELDGHQTVTASCAQEAIAAIAAHQPICVILDLLMPGVGGAELARRIRAENGSDMVRESDQEAAERSGVDYVLHKPLDVSRLRRILPRVT
jgi:CheY-like chemotaxis protein